MSAQPCILIERVVAYRVSASPRSAVQPYASGEAEIFTTIEAARSAAKNYGEGWCLPVVDMAGEARHG